MPASALRHAAIRVRGNEARQPLQVIIEHRLQHIVLSMSKGPIAYIALNLALPPRYCDGCDKCICLPVGTMLRLNVRFSIPHGHLAIPSGSMGTCQLMQLPYEAAGLCTHAERCCCAASHARNYQ
eukprot:TRINITY_DN9924_c0_g1_i1.p1 TRINITY_DN9924_c0_g1~~TRINITY_DN9924_c0_g1_i1.p1  ORF type:complete len:125 (-),score=2.50 TRINITY_DN9924_c0_g1_i1:583-957(-)